MWPKRKKRRIKIKDKRKGKEGKKYRDRKEKESRSKKKTERIGRRNKNKTEKIISTLHSVTGKMVSKTDSNLDKILGILSLITSSKRKMKTCTRSRGTITPLMDSSNLTTALGKVPITDLESEAVMEVAVAQ